MKTDKLLLNLYLLAGIVHIYCIEGSIESVGVITKYLLMPLLAGYILVSAKQQIGAVAVLLTAIVFSWFGDILLMYTDRKENYFLFGLVAFLLAHVFYIFSFRKYVWKNQANKIQVYWYLPALIYAVGFLYWLYPKLEDMTVPVIIYTVVITCMLITAIRRSGRTTNYSFLFVLIGAISFVASDSMIAVNKFAFPVEHAGILIMATYIIAQYLIVTGCLLHLKEDE